MLSGQAGRAAGPGLGQDMGTEAEVGGGHWWAGTCVPLQNGSINNLRCQELVAGCRKRFC